MKKPNILIVLLDGCRADRLGCYGYEKRKTSPNIDGLAEKSFIALNNYSTSNCTMPSVVSMMTGIYPCRHKASSTLAYYDGEYPFLTEILRKNGYYTFGVSNNLAAMSPEWGFVRGYDAFYRVGKEHSWFKESKEQARGVRKESLEVKIKRKIMLFLGIFAPYIAKKIIRRSQMKHYEQKDMGGKKAVDAFEQALNEREKNKPFFGYVNLPDTHHPYFAPTPFFNKFDNTPITDKLLKFNTNPSRFYFDGDSLDQDEIDQLQVMYDRSVAYSDAQVGRMLDILDSQALRDGTVIIFAADHGGMLYEKNKLLGSTCSTYEPEIRVPLIVYNSKLPLTQTRALTSVIDIFPTVLDIANITYDVSYKIDGVSLFNTKIGHNDIVIDYPKYPNWLKENLQGYSMINYAIFSKVNRTYINKDGKKLIWTSTEEPECYDLNNDPNETKNLFCDAYMHLVEKMDLKYRDINSPSYNYNYYYFNDIGLGSSKISLKKEVNNKRIINIS